MTFQIFIELFPWIIAAAWIGGGAIFRGIYKEKADREKRLAQKYKVQRDESRATGRILLEHQENVQEVRRAGAEIVNDIKEAKSEKEAVGIIARLTTDWNAGL